MSNVINVARSSMPDFEEFCEEIRDMWDTHWLTNMGEKHQRLQKELEDYLGIKHVTLFTNGHLALENVLEGLGLHGEIITTPYTFASTTHAIVRSGLIPVFCDISPKDYCIDPDRIEALITPNTSAILPVHVYGNLCNVEAIARIAQRHHLRVLYDAAHAFGVRYQGISSACFGDAAVFSFHATKVFHTIEGGAVCFSDDTLVQRFNDLKNFGIHDAESVPFIGGNAKMSEFQAAMGICNLRHFDEETEKRGKVYAYYRSRLSGVEGILLCEPQKDVTPNYAYFPVIFDGKRLNRDEICEKLAANGIFARKYFYPLTNDFGCYQDHPNAGSDKTPVAKHIAQRVLTLPMYADLQLQDAERICDLILTE